MQKGPKHPRATTGEATEIVSVSDGSDVERWDETRGSDDALKFGEFPAVLRLLNNAEPADGGDENAHAPSERAVRVGIAGWRAVAVAVAAGEEDGARRQGRFRHVSVRLIRLM